MGVPKIPWGRGVRAVGPLVAVLCLSACDGLLEPDAPIVADPLPASFWAGAADEGPIDPTQHDPRALVFEELGPPGPILERLGVGQCVLHYRRWNGEYTPIPFRLELGSQGGAGSPRSVVYRGRGYGELQVRGVCRVPRSEAAMKAAAAQLRARARQPAFVRDEAGRLRLYEPAFVELTAYRGNMNGLIDEAEAFGGGMALLVRKLLTILGPEPLAAQSDLEWECSEDYYEDPCEIDDITVTGEDPCGDGYYWDSALGKCVCGTCDDGTVTPPPPSDDVPDDGGGGTGGSSDSEGECFDERDVLAAEYMRAAVAWKPHCSVFTNTGGSANFSWNELNDWVRDNHHYPWSYINPSLTTGLEATLRNYGRDDIRLSSAYRCPEGNKAAGGSVNSFHLHGRASDMYARRLSWTQQEFDLLRAAAWSTNPRPVELLYWTSYTDRHLHVAW